MIPDLNAAAIAHDVLVELNRAQELFPELQSSLHEGYSVLQEEVDEFWAEVKVKQVNRDMKAMGL
jgi:hypothetical protein